jgi:uncharacterized protein
MAKFNLPFRDIKVEYARSHPLTKVVVIALILVCMAAMITLSWTGSRLRREIAQLRQEAAVLAAENAELKEKIENLDSLEGEDIDTYLENTYDTLGFGYGQDHDGVLLLICMEPREWRILSNGFAGEAIDPDAIEKIGEAFTSDLSDGNYAEAFDTFADKCEYYLDGYLNGFPFEFGKALLISLGVGILIALGITKGWKKQLKSVQKQSKANAYVKAGSMKITQSGDYFMYRNLTKTQRQKSSSSSSGGGSSRSTGGGSF